MDDGSRLVVSFTLDEAKELAALLTALPED
jgi:hypothetical protein